MKDPIRDDCLPESTSIFSFCWRNEISFLFTNSFPSQAYILKDPVRGFNRVIKVLYSDHLLLDFETSRFDKLSIILHIVSLNCYGLSMICRNEFFNIPTAYIFLNFSVV